jgi:hypothetical protein
MGARTNFTFKTDGGTMSLYSHWGGDSKMSDLACALAKAMPRIKMGDVAYALRITVSHLINDSWDSETGYGIFLGDQTGEEQYEPVTVNFTDYTIEDNEGIHRFDEFIKYHAGVLV